MFGSLDDVDSISMTYTVYDYPTLTVLNGKPVVKEEHKQLFNKQVELYAWICPGDKLEVPDVEQFMNSMDLEDAETMNLWQLQAYIFEAKTWLIDDVDTGTK